MGWVEKNKIILILLICCIGFFLRFYALGEESYWFDEEMSLYFSQQNLGSILNPPSYEAHIPPLYYILLHFWIGIVGTSEIAVRSLSAVFGSLSILALYKLGKYMFNVKIGIYSSLIFAFSIFHIYFSQEARMYSFLTFTTLISILFFLKSLNENRLRFWVGYVISSVLMLYTHFYGVFILTFQFCYFLFYYRHEIGCAKKASIAFFLVIFGFIPWLTKLFGVTPYFLGGNSSIAWIPEPNAILILETILIFCNSSVIGLLVFGHSIRSVFQLTGLKSYFHKSSLSENLKRIKAFFFNSSESSINFCFIWVGIPIILSLLFSLIFQPIYVPRYFIIVSPAIYLLVSKGLTKQSLKVKSILVLILLIDSAMISYSYYTNFNKEQWREVTNYVQDREGAGDLILINADYLELNFKLYYTGTNPVKGIATVDQLNEALQTNENQKVWLILSHNDIADPDGQIRKALDTIYQFDSKKEFSSLNILNNISIFGYPITAYSIDIEIYCYMR